MSVHIVQKGDTLWKIAKQHQIPFDELKRLNAHLANPDYIVPGMEIFLPEAASMPKRKKEMPTETPAMPMPVPPTSTQNEIPSKETPVLNTPSQQAPSWMPFPQPIPMPMPFPQPMQPIMMPQAPPQPIRMEQPSMPMQCPSCRMTVMIAMPSQVEAQQQPIKEQPTVPCSPSIMPQMETQRWMQPPPMHWGGSHCRSCQQPVPFYPGWYWPTESMPYWSQAPIMNESPSTAMQLSAGTEHSQPPDFKCEMQQHIVNQYYDEIREIEQSNRPCHPQMLPPQPQPYFQ